MHLTTEEVALASVAIGGLIGSLAGTARDRSNEGRDHQRRLWEREMEIYESLLLLASSKSAHRDALHFVFEIETTEGRGLWLDKIGKEGADFSTQRRTLAQLSMFGQPKVQQAQKEYERLDAEYAVRWALVMTARNEAAADENYDPEELAKAIGNELKALDAADKAEQYLTNVITAAARRVPTTTPKKRRKLMLSRWTS